MKKVMKLGISGTVKAKCKKCKCVYEWTLNTWPFLDSEIIGTCKKCFHKVEHDCINEFEEDENFNFAVVGHKTFKNKKG